MDNILTKRILTKLAGLMWFFRSKARCISGVNSFNAYDFLQYEHSATLVLNKGMIGIQKKWMCLPQKNLAYCNTDKPFYWSYAALSYWHAFQKRKS